MRPNIFKEEIPSNPTKSRENVGRGEKSPTILYDSKQKAQDRAVVKLGVSKKPKGTKLERPSSSGRDIKKTKADEETTLLRLIGSIPSRTATVTYMVGARKEYHSDKVRHEAFVTISRLIKRMGMEEHIQINLIEDK